MSTNPWRRGSLNDNPYYRNAFRVARVPREVVRHRTMVQLIGQARRIVNTDPEEHTIGGTPVTEAEINQAEQILLDPVRRIAEELLEHAAERPPLDEVRRRAKEVAAALSGEDSQPMAVTNLRGLRLWAQQLAQQFLDETESPDAGFGTAELELTPPFGTPEET